VLKVAYEQFPFAVGYEEPLTVAKRANVKLGPISASDYQYGEPVDVWIEH
jgi:hypothetical protein